MTRDSLDLTPGSQPMTPVDGSDGDLAASVTAKIVGVVDKLNGLSAKPLTLVARAIVLGLFGLVLVVTALVMLTIGALRALDVYLPGDVWAAHLVLGSVFTLAGLLAWAKRKPRAQ